jgi:nucleoside-diphosphate-sugar epimerase
MTRSVLALLGCGDLGTALGLRLQALGQEVLAVRRQVALLPPALPALALDYTDRDQFAPLAEPDVASVLLTPTPVTRDIAGYEQGYLRPVQNLLDRWQGGPARRILFVSSTRVYGQDAGEWVDETTEPRPQDGQGAVILEAEQRLLASPHHVTVVRFGGIYGRLPSALLDRLRQGRFSPARPVHYGNRIHREDCIGFLEHLLAVLDDPGPLYIGVDDLPAPRHEVEAWLAAQLGVSAEAAAAPVEDGPCRGKRCRNLALHASGYRLRFRDYRQGYRDVLDRLATEPG